MTAAEKNDGANKSSQKLRVLFVEDSPKDVKLMTAILVQAGYSLDIASVDRQDSLKEYLAANEPDVIISDYNLRGWTAIDALEILEKSGKTVPVIIVSGSLGDEAAADCIKQGASDYVLKDRLARLPNAVLQAIERKKSKEALQRSEAENRQMVQHAPIGIYRSSIKDDGFLSVNPGLVSMLGYSSAEELLRVKISRDVYLNAADRERILERSSLLGTYLGIEVHWKRKDGKPITVRLSGRTLREGSETVANEVFAEDITDYHSLQKQLLQAQKMEAVGRLAGGVAHDFNNLLGIVLGYSDLLSLEKTLGEQARHRLEEITKAGQRAVALTRQLLAFSRKQVFETRTLDLNQLLKGTTGMLQRLMGEDVALTAELDPNLGLVTVDPTQIEQIIMNLAVNSRDAMPNGGELTIHTSNVTLDDAYGERHMHVPPGEYVMLAVSDTGAGMDAETQKQIFEPFFTTKGIDRGTGLGLSTVYGIVKQSGGYIWVYSEVGIGTTFKIYLPRVQGVADSLLTSVRPTEIARGSETILLVEDDAALRTLGRELLEEMGYVVLDASKPSEALTVSERHSGPIHLLMTDVIMPGMNGKQLADQLLQSRPNMKVMYVSGYTDNIIRNVISSTGAAFLQKPFTRATLSKKLRGEF
jgi:two-component system cell cycle sensor histidine kinase/response regulator CckA